jgi:hypothetical protein
VVPIDMNVVIDTKMMGLHLVEVLLVEEEMITHPLVLGEQEIDLPVDTAAADLQWGTALEETRVVAIEGNAPFLPVAIMLVAVVLARDPRPVGGTALEAPLVVDTTIVMAEWVDTMTTGNVTADEVVGYQQAALLVVLAVVVVVLLGHGAPMATVVNAGAAPKSIEEDGMIVGTALSVV